MTPIDPARLAARLARTPFVTRIVVLETTASTNDDARRLAASGSPEGTVVLAESQTSGRGRLGHAWNSPEGGLYLSVVLRPQEPPAMLGRYALTAAVAVADACCDAGARDVSLKWPNDVLARGRKLGGILVELRHDPSGVEMIAGIGVNVLQGEGDFPPTLSRTATSLRLAGARDPGDRETVAVRVLTHLAASLAVLRAGHWDEIAERFVRYAPSASGRSVRLRTGERGTTTGLDPSGALRVSVGDRLVLVHSTESVATIEG